MKKVVTVFAVIALAVVVASPAMAYRCMGETNRGPCNFEPMDMTRGINLTAEQTEKISALRETHLKEIKPIKDQIYSKQGDLKILWLAKEPDKEKILDLQKEVQNLRGQMMEKATIHRLEVRKVLTPEQLAKVQPYPGMGRHMARGGAAMGCMSDRDGRGGMRCGAGMKPMCDDSGMKCMCDGTGMRSGCAPCWRMR